MPRRIADGNAQREDAIAKQVVIAAALKQHFSITPEQLSTFKNIANTMMGAGDATEIVKELRKFLTAVKDEFEAAPFLDEEDDHAEDPGAVESLAIQMAAVAVAEVPVAAVVEMPVAAVVEVVQVPMSGQNRRFLLGEDNETRIAGILAGMFKSTLANVDWVHGQFNPTKEIPKYILKRFDGSVFVREHDLIPAVEMKMEELGSRVAESRRQLTVKSYIRELLKQGLLRVSVY